MRFLAHGGGVGTRTVGCRSDVGEGGTLCPTLVNKFVNEQTNEFFLSKKVEKKKKEKRTTSFARERLAPTDSRSATCAGNTTSGCYR
jgi:hypothetical protein